MGIAWAYAQRLFATAALCLFVAWPAQGGDPPVRPDAVSHTPSPSRAVASETAAWRRITLGTYKNVNLLREDLDSIHCGAWAKPQVAATADVSLAIKKPRTTCNLGDA